MPNRKVLVPVGPLPVPTAHDLLVGWPAHLCGGPLLVDDPRYLTDGVIVEVSPELAETMGAFVEDAVSDDDVWDSLTTEELQLRDLWCGVYDANPQQTGDRSEGSSLSSNRASSRTERSRLTARQMGRPSKASRLCPADKTPYREPAEYRAAVVAHCRMELAESCPFIDQNVLERIVSAICDGTRRSIAPPPHSTRHFNSEWDVCWIPSASTFHDMSEWAFVEALPPGLPRREALVRTVEFLFVREGLEWRGDELTTSRPLAVASIAIGAEIPLRGPAPWLVSAAVEAEQRAIAHTMKKIADERIPWMGSPAR